MNLPLSGTHFCVMPQICVPKRGIALWSYSSYRYYSSNRHTRIVPQVTGCRSDLTLELEEDRTGQGQWTGWCGWLLITSSRVQASAGERWLVLGIVTAKQVCVLQAIRLTELLYFFQKVRNGYVRHLTCSYRLNGKGSSNYICLENSIYSKSSNAIL